jgi:hypothetical protein
MPGPRPAFPSGISPTGFSWRSAATPTSSRASSPGPSPTRSWPWGRGGAFSPIPKGFRLGEVFPGTPAEAKVLPGLTHLDLLTEREDRTAGEVLAYLRRLGL